MQFDSQPHVAVQIPVRVATSLQQIQSNQISIQPGLAIFESHMSILMGPSFELAIIETNSDLATLNTHLSKRLYDYVGYEGIIGIVNIR